MCIKDICTKIWRGERCYFVPTFSYQGVPYKWGWFDTPENFIQNLNNGYSADNKPKISQPKPKCFKKISQKVLRPFLLDSNIPKTNLNS